MNITITPTKLKGAITPPPSKSQAHRLIIAAALADGESVISNVAFSQDIEATVRCLEQLGAEFCRDGSALTVHGIGANAMSPMRRLASPRMDCGESGSTLRFLIPVALAVCGGGSFTGRGRLMERPQKPYFDLFDKKGVSYGRENGVLTVGGWLEPGTYALPGDVSSQFVTGLLYSLPLLNGDSDIVLTSSLESRGYVDMTLEAQRQFGVTAVPTKTGFHIPGGQTYQARNAEVEADWSQAAFWYAAQCIGNDVTVTGMEDRSIQGDRRFADWMRMVQNKPLNGGISVPIGRPDGNAETLATPSGGYSVSIDVSQNPDLVPPLAAMGALMNGALYIKNAARLRIKESDRLASVTAVLNAMGAQVEEHPDSLTIVGRDSLAGGVTVDSCNDHRIAMMAAVAATRCREPVTITGAECVAKSYPNFWEDYEMLGGQLMGADPIKENFPEALKLVTPTMAYAQQLAAYRREFLDTGGSMDGCGPLRRYEDPKDWLDDVERYTSKETVPDGHVQATQFLCVRVSDDRLVGMIQIRHYFNGYLRDYAGHIGYSVRPSERRKGYAKEMLRQCLLHCRTLGLDRVLISCIDSNEASRRTILANGGVYEKTVFEPNEQINLERYWITL